jgi:uncharacterized protein YndB with AHSA1/START domain
LALSSKYSKKVRRNTMAHEGFLYQTIINATPEKVWHALTTPEFTKMYWFGRSVVSDWKIGSEVKIITPDGNIEVKGTVLEAEPGKRLSYTWGSGTQTDKTKVVFEITQMGPLVKLLITHDIDMSGSGAVQAASGWTLILCGLKTYLETGKPLPSIPWKK